jgi:hypothetical protein
MLLSDYYSYIIIKEFWLRKREIDSILLIKKKKQYLHNIEKLIKLTQRNEK